MDQDRDPSALIMDFPERQNLAVYLKLSVLLRVLMGKVYSN
jgi:hypothetical protein